jgi:hypothetical protein
VFFAETAIFCKKLSYNIGFGGKRQFFAENWQKSQKLVIINIGPCLSHFIATYDHHNSNALLMTQVF